jgi:hypothetical protein
MGSHTWCVEPARKIICGGFAVCKSETILKEFQLPDKILFASDYYI